MKPLKAPGMEEAGIYHYLEYEQHEIDIMKPGRTFKVLDNAVHLRQCLRLPRPITLDYTSKKREREYVEEGGHMIKRVKVIDLTED